MESTGVWVIEHKPALPDTIRTLFSFKGSKRHSSFLLKSTEQHKLKPQQNIFKNRLKGKTYVYVEIPQPRKRKEKTPLWFEYLQLLVSKLRAVSTSADCSGFRAWWGHKPGHPRCKPLHSSRYIHLRKNVTFLFRVRSVHGETPPHLQMKEVASGNRRSPIVRGTLLFWSCVHTRTARGLDFWRTTLRMHHWISSKRVYST